MPYANYGLTFVDPSNNYYNVWHEGNDGSGSGLDADLLDGKHYSDILADVKHVAQAADFTNASGTIGDLKDTLLTYFAEQGSGMGDNICVSQSLIDRWDDDTAQLVPSSSALLIKIGAYGSTSSYGQWIVGGYGDKHIHVIGRSNGWTKNTIAYITDNVASATKLQTVRYLWGNSFDGTATVNGTIRLPNNQKINSYKTDATTEMELMYVSTNNDLHIGYGPAYYGLNTFIDGNNIVFRYSASRVEGIRLTNSGNVGIGTSSPAYKLDVSGDIIGGVIRARNYV